MVEDVDVLLHVKFRWILFSGIEAKMMPKLYLLIRGHDGHIGYPIRPKKIEFCSAIAEKKSIMSKPIRDQDGYLCFPIGPKNTNLVENVEILLPVKFRLILFCGCREEVENVSTNQKSGQPFWFSDYMYSENANLVARGRWLSTYIVVFSFYGFRSAVSGER